MTAYTVKEFLAQYSEDEACLAEIMRQKHGGTVLTCPACGVAEAKFHPMTKRRAFACQECGHHIYPCAGTIFEKSSTRLSKWFFAMYLMTSTRHGVAAKEIERQVGVTYKTAWRMCHELRKLMARADYQGPLQGHVEIDETLVGPRKKTNKGGPRKGKTVVFGIVERDGVVRTGIIPDTTMKTMEPIIQNNVLPGSTITTDAYHSYNALQVSPYQHVAVNHLKKEWTRGKHHTNTIEGYWGHFKRSVRGTHVQISQKHLWKYLCEFSCRYNQRKSHSDMFKKLIASFSLPRLVEP
jgi:transposase-like protein/predicted RNA-binding Zn-ribbon protein involved in translation (DUF1610 family)